MKPTWFLGEQTELKNPNKIQLNLFNYLNWKILMEKDSTCCSTNINIIFRMMKFIKTITKLF